MRRYTEVLRTRPKVLCTCHQVMKVYSTLSQVTDDYEGNYNTCLQVVWMILSVGKAHFIKYWWNFRSGTHFYKYWWLCLKVLYISTSSMIMSKVLAYFIKCWWNSQRRNTFLQVFMIDSEDTITSEGTIHFYKYRLDDYVYRFSTFHQYIFHPVLMKFPKVEHISPSIYDNFWRWNKFLQVSMITSEGTLHFYK